MKDNKRWIILIIMVVVAGCILCGILTSDDERESTTSTGPATPVVTATAGPQFDPEDWSVTVLDGIRMEGSIYSSAAGGMVPASRILVGVEIENRSDQTIDVKWDSFSLDDPSGVALNRFGESPYIPLPLGEVGAGASIQGDLFFTLPEVDSELEQPVLVFHFLWGGEEREITVPLEDVTDLIQVDLRQGLAQGLFDIEVLGESLESIDVKIKPKIESEFDLTYEVVITPGTTFIAPSGSLQNMVVRLERTVMVRQVFEISADLEIEFEVSVACGNMQLDGPEGGEVYTLSQDEANEDLVKLFALPVFHEQTFRVQQFAIWTITDNPSRDGYVGLGYFGTGSGPNDEEMTLILEIFVEAEIPLERYWALQ